MTTYVFDALTVIRDIDDNVIDVTTTELEFVLPTGAPSTFSYTIISGPTADEPLPEVEFSFEPLLLQFEVGGEPANGDNLDAYFGTVNLNNGQSIVTINIVDRPIGEPATDYFIQFTGTDLSTIASNPAQWAALETSVASVGPATGAFAPGQQIAFTSAVNFGFVSEDDIFVGGDADNDFNLGIGNDQVAGQSGNDTIRGEDGDDMLSGEIGTDLLIGGNGNDTLAGNEGSDTLIGGAGDDSLSGGLGTGDPQLTDGGDYLIGGAGNDTLLGMEGNDTLEGGDPLDFDTVFQGVQLIGFDSENNDTDEILYTTVSFNFFDDITSLSYTYLNGTDVEATLNLPADPFQVVISDEVFLAEDLTEFEIGNFTWSGGTSTLAIFEFFENEDAFYIFYELDGVPLPTFANTAAFNNFADNQIIAEAQISSGPFAPNQDIALTDIFGQPIVNTPDLGQNLLDGGSGDDDLFGGAGNDVLIGGEGEDTLEGSIGADTMTGGAGSDVFIGAALDFDGDVVTDFSDEDNFLIEIDSQAPTATLNGSVLEIDTNIDGSADAMVTLQGFTGDIETSVVTNIFGTFLSVIEAEPEPTNVITGGDTGGVLPGTTGNDSITAGIGDDFVQAGDGDDTVLAGDGNDQVTAGDGDDSVDGGAGNDNIAASAGDDTVDGGPGNDSLGGGDGVDSLLGSDGNDIIGGGTGNDYIDAGAGNDNMSGGFGADTVLGGLGDDTMAGSFGADLVDGGAGDDLIGGGGGIDTISGGDGNDSIGGGDGGDLINGDAGDDFIGGGAGDDVIFGNAGNDTINGGEGSDVMRGGSGADVFVFNEFTQGELDFVYGFQDGIDKIRFNVEPGFQFSDLTITAFTGAGGINFAQIEFEGHTIRLGGMAPELLTANDFVFV